MSNPARYDYDPDEFYYDEDSDTLVPYAEGASSYDGWGEQNNDDDD